MEDLGQAIDPAKMTMRRRRELVSSLSGSVATYTPAPESNSPGRLVSYILASFLSSYNAMDFTTDLLGSSESYEGSRVDVTLSVLNIEERRSG